MRVSRLYGSVRAAASDGRPYRDPDLDPMNQLTVGLLLVAGLTCTAMGQSSLGTVSVVQTTPADAPPGTAVASVISSPNGALNVKAFGALGNGSHDDATNLQTAFDAGCSSGAGVFLPAGNYLSSVSLSINYDNCSIRGGNGATITFFGATDGLVLAERHYIYLGGFKLSTTSASAGKALSITHSDRSHYENLFIASSGSGRWSYGVWTSNAQSSMYTGIIIYQSATVGIHLEYNSGGNTWIIPQVTGTSGVGTITTALEIGAGSSNRWYYPIFQGYFATAVISASGVDSSFFGLHLENTNISPSSGYDVHLLGAMTNTSFSAVQGGSFGVGTDGSTVRNFTVSNSEVRSITLGSGVQSSSIVFSRIDTRLTDSGSGNRQIGIYLGSANAMDKIPGVPIWHLLDLKKIANGVAGCANTNGCWTVAIDGGTAGTPVPAASSFTQNITLFQLPAWGYIDTFSINTQTACTGTTTAKTGIGTISSDALYSPKIYDISAAPSNTVIPGAQGATMQGSTSFAAQQVVASLVTTGSNVDHLIAGCRIWYFLKYTTMK